MRVLVTGANGHLGLALCRALLLRGGYRVRASVRSLADTSKAAPVKALGDLELVELDVRDPAAFDAALRGVEVLFHVAATYALFSLTAVEEAELVRDSVEGVEVALRSASRARVRRVVLTSSVVTLPLVRPGEPPVHESHWQPDLRLAYFRAKTEGERLAWRLAEELGLPLVTILPGGIGGPGFLRLTPTLDLIEGILLGAMRLGAPSGNFTYVDVRDVAEAHVLAAEKDVAGRFVVNLAHPSFVELSRLLHELDPKVPAAPYALPSFLNPLLPVFDRLNARLLGSPRLITPDGAAVMRGRVFHVSSARARDVLGWAPRVPLLESLGETVESIRALRRSGSNRQTAPEVA